MTTGPDFTIGRAEPLDDRRRGPAYEQATVRDAMHPGIITCPPETSLVEVARILAEHEVHCVAVLGLSVHAERERLVWGILSDIDLVRAIDAHGLDGLTAGEIAGTEPVTISADEPLAAAARAMGEHDVHHLVVVSGKDPQPVGIVSSLDVAEAIARSR